MFEVEKLKDMPEGVGIDSEHLSPQQRRAMLACRDCSLLFALSQQDIIFESDECRGVPEATPPARVESKKSNVSRLSINLNV